MEEEVNREDKILKRVPVWPEHRADIEWLVKVAQAARMWLSAVDEESAARMDVGASLPLQFSEQDDLRSILEGRG